MKKLIYFAAAVGVCALMAACSSKNSNDTAIDAAADSTLVEATAADSAAVDSAETVAGVFEYQPGDNIIPGDRPIVVDFWATWCGPCMQFKPVFHEAAEKYGNKVSFASVDVDACKEIAEKYKVSSIPTVIIVMPDGSTREKTGFMTMEEFEAFLGDAVK